jgi:hypothetical protein
MGLRRTGQELLGLACGNHRPLMGTMSALYPPKALFIALIASSMLFLTSSGSFMSESFKILFSIILS